MGVSRFSPTIAAEACQFATGLDRWKPSLGAVFAALHRLVTSVSRGRQVARGSAPTNKANASIDKLNPRAKTAHMIFHRKLSF